MKNGDNDFSGHWNYDLFLFSSLYDEPHILK